MYTGLKYFLQAWSYLFHSGLRRYFIFSALASLSLFVFLTWGIVGASDVVAGWMSEWIPWSWSGESALFQWILSLLSFVFLFGVYKYIVLIVLGPILSLLSERLEHIISPHKKGRKVPGMFIGLIRGIRLNVFNLLKELILTSGLFLVSFIPGVAIITAPVILLVQAYYAGYGVMDFYLERYTDYQTSNIIVFRYKWFAIVTGLLFIFLFAIPFLGMIFAPMIGVLAATLFFEKEKIFLDR
ncbi:MAG: EI24 domain-containing protein [Saprospiraceae bacterium]|nr:EI24 domain-containing protein [Saprospiraceae bacterium]